MDEKLKDLLVAGAMFVASLIWAAVKSSKEKRRQKTSRVMSKPQQWGTAWSATGGSPATDYAGSVSKAAAASQTVQRPTVQTLADRLDTAAKLPPVVDDEAATVSDIDGETLRQAVKWSVILEKKF